MVFLGRNFAGNKRTMSATAINIKNLEQVIIQNGIFDELFITRDVFSSYTLLIPEQWDFNTIMHALFEGNLHGGNVNYTAEQVSSVRIKRREKGTYDWLTLFDVPITSPDDFSFKRYDRYARSEVEYEYALVPVLNTAEGNININSITSRFDGMFIAEKDASFSTMLDIAYSTQRNTNAGIINTINSKYPYLVQNGRNNYETINCTATFMRYDTKLKDWEKDYRSFDFRWSLDDFLTSGHAKILKMPYTGEIWLVMVTGDPIVKSSAGHRDYITTSINFVEIGSYLSSTDLYDNGLIDVNVEGS